LDIECLSARLSRREPESVPAVLVAKGPLASYFIIFVFLYKSKHFLFYQIVHSWEEEEADRAKASSFRPLFPK